MLDWALPEFLNDLRILAGGLIVLVGAIVSFIGAVGVIRFPDFYTRMHAASVTDTLGATLMLAGMMLLAGWSLVTVKIFLIWLFIFLTSPTASNAAAHAALTAGLSPLLGKWDGERCGDDPIDDGETSLVANSDKGG